MVQASVPASPRESVIVVMDANRSKGSMDALDWALKSVVRRQDTVIVLGVSCAFGKKNSCFPLNMGISISAIWERLEFSSQGQGEARPKELGEEIERKKEQYQNNLQPFYRLCRKNEVNMEVKLAFGFCPEKITVEQAQNSNPRWIVLDSNLKKHKVIIYAHVGCNIAVMNGKHVATLTPSRAPPPGNCTPTDDTTYTTNQTADNQDGFAPSQDGESSARLQSPCWYPLSWRNGFPRAFTQTELEEITNDFSEDNLIRVEDNIMVYEGIFQETPVVIMSFPESDERFWKMLKILSRVRHRNIANLVGFCCTGTSLFLLFDYPCLGTLELNLLNDNLARNLPWKARWYIAVEIGGSLRYLHEENANLEEDDVRGYGMLLIELISGKSARLHRNESGGQSLIQWALPLLENGQISEVLDPRLEDNADIRVAYHMVKAALLCLRSDADHRISMSEVLAVVRGDQLAMAKC
ncbi:hypothetical protein GH714_018688 [Hevea brasiliensis]|uniref:non-specific serine/threonine protein kinase n=1 Tax=Hevea brasiliensis TaxID=3981 RepID=A0A6A6N5K0_HEVBR|nr:hypothetical protein GH714_018688 [Hevea brasiliensis]